MLSPVQFTTPQYGETFFLQDVDEDHIKNTTCKDPMDHQEHTINQVHFFFFMKRPGEAGADQDTVYTVKCNLY